jgi:hypothetical protein
MSTYAGRYHQGNRWRRHYSGRGGVRRSGLLLRNSGPPLVDRRDIPHLHIDADVGYKVRGARVVSCHYRVAHSDTIYYCAAVFIHAYSKSKTPSQACPCSHSCRSLPPTALPQVNHDNEESTLATQVMLACSACRDAGLAAQCKHMLHLVPQWQSSARHERLKAVMSDRPDLIQSELAGLAFDALQQCFRTGDIDSLMNAPAPALMWQQPLYMVIDPAAGGPQSDFALITFFRHRGQIVVRLPIMIGPSALPVSYDRRYSTLSSRSKSSRRNVSFTRKRSTSVAFKTFKKRAAL